MALGEETRCTWLMAAPTERSAHDVSGSVSDEHLKLQRSPSRHLCPLRSALVFHHGISCSTIATRMGSGMVSLPLNIAVSYIF